MIKEILQYNILKFVYICVCNFIRSDQNIKLVYRIRRRDWQLFTRVIPLVSFD